MQRSRDDGEYRLVDQTVRAAPSNRCWIQPHRTVSFGAQRSRADEHHIAQSSQDVENPFVRLSGKAYVYVQTANGQFTRREIRTDSPVSAGYFIGNQLAPGTRIVVAGAQTLLSEEFKPEGVSEE